MNTNNGHTIAERYVCQTKHLAKFSTFQQIFVVTIAEIEKKITGFLIAIYSDW